MDFLAELKHSLENMTSRFWNYSVTVDVNPTGANLSVQQGQEDIQATVGIIAVLCLLVAGKRLLNFSPSSCGKFSLSHVPQICILATYVVNTVQRIHLMQAFIS